VAALHINKSNVAAKSKTLYIPDLYRTVSAHPTKFLVKFKTWKLCTTWHYNKLESF